ncbi:hypothetical protein HAV2_gp15 [Hyperthermophilic Archaeal Virus 2]|jgi:hypothetical protein|uniref:hypothetical protein n=1 Tax=Hyperthermophilic Archaeal Virus 2 TaxID=762906 RepID=UPI0001DBAE22|nr:hypothetical protein HAV2_gp15 [Hyperthermophilic Archaeal Virus 2]ADJ54278.1 hypothetical protein HAV2_gp15 [Hyperthermophilic Archaeal Virus 2]
MSQPRIRIKRSAHGVVKKKVLELLLTLDESQEYPFTELVRYFIKNEISPSTAIYYAKYFPEIGVLSKTETGRYRVNKELARKMLEELTGKSSP